MMSGKGKDFAFGERAWVGGEEGEDLEERIDQEAMAGKIAL